MAEMKIGYKGKEYLFDLLADGKNHYGIIHISDEIKIKFTRNQSKSIQTEFAEKMDSYFSQKM